MEGDTEVAAYRDEERGEVCGLRSVAIFRSKPFSTAVTREWPTATSIWRRSGISDSFSTAVAQGGHRRLLEYSGRATCKLQSVRTYFSVVTGTHGCRTYGIARGESENAIARPVRARRAFVSLHGWRWGR